MCLCVCVIEISETKKRNFVLPRTFASGKSFSWQGEQTAFQVPHINGKWWTYRLSVNVLFVFLFGFNVQHSKSRPPR